MFCIVEWHHQRVIVYPEIFTMFYMLSSNASIAMDLSILSQNLCYKYSSKYMNILTSMICLKFMENYFSFSNIPYINLSNLLKE